MFNSQSWWKNVKVGRSVVSDSLQSHGLHSPLNSPGQNTGVGSPSLVKEIFLTQGSNLGLPTLQADSLPAEPQGKPSSELVTIIIYYFQLAVLFLIYWEHWSNHSMATNSSHQSVTISAPVSTDSAFPPVAPSLSVCTWNPVPFTTPRTLLQQFSISNFLSLLHQSHQLKTCCYFSHIKPKRKKTSSCDPTSAASYTPVLLFLCFPLQQNKTFLCFIQHFHFWVYTQKNWKQGLEEIFAHSCS